MKRVVIMALVLAIGGVCHAAGQENKLCPFALAPDSDCRGGVWSSDMEDGCKFSEFFGRSFVKIRQPLMTAK